MNKLEYNRTAKIRAAPGDVEGADYGFQEIMREQEEAELDVGFINYQREIEEYVRNPNLEPPDHGEDDINFTRWMALYQREHNVYDNPRYQVHFNFWRDNTSFYICSARRRREGSYFDHMINRMLGLFRVR